MNFRVDSNFELSTVEDYEQMLQEKDETIEKQRQWIQEYGIPGQENIEIAKENLSAMIEREKHLENEIFELKKCYDLNFSQYSQLEYDYNDSTEKYQLLVKEYQLVIQCNDQLTNDLRDEKLRSTHTIEQQLKLKNVQSLNERYSSMNDFLMKKETIANEEKKRNREKIKNLEKALKLTLLQLSDIQQQPLTQGIAAVVSPIMDGKQSVKLLGNSFDFLPIENVNSNDCQKISPSKKALLSLQTVPESDHINVTHNIANDDSNPNSISTTDTAVFPHLEIQRDSNSSNISVDSYMMKRGAAQPAWFRMSSEINNEILDTLVLTYAQNADDIYSEENASVFSEIQIDRIREEISLELEEIIKVEQESKWKLHFDQQRLILDEEIYELKRKLRRMSDTIFYKSSSIKCDEKSHSDTDENTSLINGLMFSSQMTITGNSPPSRGFRSLFSSFCGGQADDVD